MTTIPPSILAGAREDRYAPDGPGDAIQHAAPVADHVSPAIVEECESMTAKAEAHSHPGSDAPAGICSTVFALLTNFMPVGGMLASGFNMASTSIGAGILGLPAAFNSVGIAMATVYLVLVTAETVYSMRLVVIASDKTGKLTYEELATTLLHPKADYFVVFIRVLHSFGACIAYVVTVGNLLEPILRNASGTPEYLLTTSGTRVLQVALWAGCFLPLCIPRQVNSLRYISACGVGLMVFFCAVVMAHSGMHGLKEDPRPKVVAVQTGNGAIEGLGVFIFSYMCQINCAEIYAEMTKRNPRRFTLCAAVSMTVCGLLYYLTGLLGYLDFGEVVTDSVLTLYNPIDEPQVLVSYIGVFIKICASYGLLGHACRSAIHHVTGSNYQDVSTMRHLIVSFSVAGLTLLCGLFIPNVNLVFGFVGGFCGGFVAFILPALFIMYSGNWSWSSVGPVNYICTYLTLIAGVVAVVFGTGSTIYSAV